MLRAKIRPETSMTGWKSDLPGRGYPPKRQIWRHGETDTESR